jgi:hypothetical protein
MLYIGVENFDILVDLKWRKASKKERKKKRKAGF